MKEKNKNPTPFVINVGNKNKTNIIKKDDLKEKGKYEITSAMKKKLDLFVGGYAEDKEMEKAISSLYNKDENGMELNYT